jgi:nicotinamide phosphoribosyltransferase
MQKNIILNTDSYKASQWVQYPPNTTSVSSYIEARGGEFEETVFFGLQMFIKEYLTTPITTEMIDEAEWFLKAHGEPFNRSGWEYIVNQHKGRLPIRISAVPEGTVVPTSNVLCQVENTDPLCFWLTSYIETALLRGIWYATTVATKSRETKKVIQQYLVDTADEDALGGLPFKLHDFGARGVSSYESAGIGGAAHLVNFMGTDTMTGALFAMKYYNETEVPGFSVPASEHSTITSWMKEGELDAYRNMFKQFGGEYPIVSVVSDSYDIYNAVENMWGGELKDMVEQSGSMLVVRPDSGEPAEVVVKVALLLDATFGSTVNSKGYKVLNNVRILQGDGLNNIGDFVKILAKLKGYNFSTDNVVFGQGGGLLQQVNRDTCKFAMKCSSITVDGEQRDVYKDPITDSGKRSKKGRLALVDINGVLTTVAEAEACENNLLEVVFENGKLIKDETFADIRDRASV